MHAVWTIILDDEFLQAYEHSLIITCFDGVTHQVFPCIFTYAADYQEK